MALDLGTSSSNIGDMTPAVLQGKDNVGAQYLQAMQPAKAEERRLAAESGKFEGQQAQFKAQNEAELAQATALASQKEAQQIKDSPVRAQLQEVDKELMTKEFIPTKENAKDLATLFSLINVIGFAIGAGGKGHAQAAMSAMNGMLEGHQKGRDDLYKKEKDAFETSMKTLKTKSELLHNRLKEDMEIYAKDREAGINNARAHIAEAGATFIGQNLEKYGLPTAFKLAGENVADVGKAFELVQKDKDEVAKRKMEYARLNEQATDFYTASDGKVYSINKLVDLKKQLPEGVSIVSKVGTPGRTGVGGVGAVQFRYNAAETLAANSLGMELENLTQSPLLASPPVFQSAISNPGHGINKDVVSAATSGLTDAENRAFQQVKAGVTRAETTLYAGGRPGGATQQAYEEMDKQAPQAGDSRINFYLWLGLVKQTVTLAEKDLRAAGGSPEQMAQVAAVKEKVEKIIPYSVQDVNRILVGVGGKTLVDDKVTKLLQTSKNVNQFETDVQKYGGLAQFKDEAAALKALKDGKIERGQNIIVGGKPASFPLAEGQ